MIARRTVLAGGLAALAVPVLAAPLTYPITPIAIGDGVWMVAGADEPILRANGGAIANITIIATSAGAVLVDAGPSLRYGEALVAVAKQLTGKPVARVYLTHLHPDHTYGDSAFDPAIVAATPALTETLKREGAGFADGMYRLLGDWMRGTEIHMPGHAITADSETVGDRSFRMLPLAGHSASDLALLDTKTGILVAGDLVFNNRAPSTPHADLPKWRTSLDTLKALGHRAVVPGHGPFDPTPTTAIAQTREWIDWLEGALTRAVDDGLDMVEAGAMPIPPRFAGMKAARYELQRSVSHLYAGIEDQRLPRVDKR
ncbi:quinoprotein relay system zinc metallohydrolase 1 [Sphingomonas donggukensis]|uniref:Quinoprotein relay system zinc metallohydrolase 1 n=1 Tax=Sphingomonas donggukensis TaxID=2949093 RepID=A0ABY4U1B6_9SPHN|nr:quinoprotein relay system zinc metallohydrolase 1 [Sphingomonas donggukensis]URW76333.1 quinoprotein relay system zinc metallohydrolase 1 [Sphingomonas donggukensis]